MLLKRERDPVFDDHLKSIPRISLLATTCCCAALTILPFRGFIQHIHRFQLRIFQELNKMMLTACSLNARPQSAVPSRSLIGQSSLRSCLKSMKRPFHARRVPTCTQGGLQQRSNSAEGDPQDPFFNRVSEQAEFMKIFNENPDRMTVLTGPSSCGKTVRSGFFFAFLASTQKW